MGIVPTRASGVGVWRFGFPRSGITGSGCGGLWVRVWGFEVWVYGFAGFENGCSKPRDRAEDALRRVRLAW